MNEGPTKADLCAAAGITGTEFDEIADAAGVEVAEDERGETATDVKADRDRLRELVREAYREGACDGYVHGGWAKSCAKDDLDKIGGTDGK